MKLDVFEYSVCIQRCKIEVESDVINGHAAHETTLSGSYARYEDKLGLNGAPVYNRTISQVKRVATKRVVEFLHLQTITLPPAPKHVRNQ